MIGKQSDFKQSYFRWFSNGYSDVISDSIYDGFYDGFYDVFSDDLEFYSKTVQMSQKPSEKTSDFGPKSPMVIPTLFRRFPNHRKNHRTYEKCPIFK